MSLTNPIYLWSLLGLAIPIAIHLLSRKEGKVIKLGSIRHVQETSTQQFRGIRLNEVLLLVMRCALIAILALGISGFHFSQKDGNWILLEPGVEKIKNVQTAMDSLEEQGYDLHWLTSSFPSTSKSPDSVFANYWLAIRQLEKSNLEQVIIFSFAKAEKFRGRQQVIPDNIRVIPVEPEEKHFVLEAVQTDDSVVVRLGISNTTLTHFQSQKFKFVHDSVRVTSPRPIKISLVGDKALEKEKQILTAAVRAIDNITPHAFHISEKASNQFTNEENPDWLFWLTRENAPVTKANLLKWSPAFTNNLIEQSGRNEWMLTQPLNEEIAIDKKLTLSLAVLLLSDSALENIASSNDQRTLSETMAWTSGSEQEFSAAIPQPFSLFLFGIFSVLFLMERYLSYRKNQ